MTDKHQNLTVVLDGDYRDDDVQAIVDAINMIKGVAKVELGEPVNSGDYLARTRVVMDIYTEVTEIFKKKMKL
jgi:hypothetical protein